MNRQVALIYLVELLRNFSIFIVGSFVVLYLRSINISMVTIGMLFSLKGALDIVFSLPIGYASDRWGRKPWIFLSPVFSIVTFILFVVCTTVYQFVFVFMVWNTAELSWQSSVPMYLNDIVEDKGRGDALAKMSLMNTIAGIVAPAIAGVIAQVYGILYIFVVAICFEAAIIGIAVYWARLGFLYKPENTESTHETKNKGKKIQQKLKNVIYLLKGNIFYFALAMMVMGFGWAILDIATPIFLKEELGISYLRFGTIMSAVSIIGAVAKIGAGKFTDIHGRRPMLVFSTIAAGICMVSIGIVSNEIQFIAVRGIGSLFGAVMWIVWMASFHDMITRKRATTSALIDTLSGITWTVGSLSAGFLIYLITARHCFFLIGVIYLCTAFIFFKIKKRFIDE
jgi:MFS family permease